MPKAHKLRRWTLEEVVFLTENYPKISIEKIAEKLSRSRHVIDSKIRNLGLRASDSEIKREELVRSLKSELNASCVERRELSRATAQIYSRKLYQQRKEDGTCLRCGGQRLPNAQMCLLHWATCIGFSCGHGDETFGRSLIEKLETQNYKCALSDIQLVPGVNASIDHICPVSQGGTSELDNLQWVLLPLNRGKGNLTADEFVELCRAVARKGKHANGQT